MEGPAQSLEYLCRACGSQGITTSLPDVPVKADRDVVVCPVCGQPTGLIRICGPAA